MINNQVIYGTPHINYTDSNGMVFYDQDIAMTNYIYTGSFKLTMNVICELSGIGIVLSKPKENEPPLNSDDVYLIRLGNNELSILHRQYAKQERIYNTSCLFVPEKDIAKTLIFYLNNKELTISTIINKKEVELGRCVIEKLPDEFYIGFYGNKRNIIQDAIIEDESPEFWLASLKNTNGGRVSFSKDTIKIENCKYDAEVEQENIPLKSGTYYIDFENKNSETKCYIFSSNNKEFKPENKNLITDTNKLILDEDTNVNILFQSTDDTIKNIAIKSSENASYVSTGDTSSGSDGSCIRIALKDLSSINITFTVNSVPQYELTEEMPYAITLSGDIKTSLADYNIQLDTSNKFYIDVDKKTIHDITTDAYSSIEDDEYLYILKNVNGFIDEFIITDKNGTQTNLLVQTTFKKYVADKITSPIVVVDENDNPLDLSSSYRLTNEDKYIFTNWEREVFSTNNNEIVLEKDISNSVGSMYVYGIYKNAEYNLSDIYKISDENNIHSIDLFCENYDIITENSYKQEGNYIEFADEILNDYSLLVVEYLKNDSYAINHIDDQYEVDISTQKELVYTCYDMTDDNEIKEYKTLDVIPADNRYIVLRK